ncbi:MAG: L-2-amino-thiazoline-4-carboxylic acid hydrolase [Eubacteriales bacterium]|nr:L-2-amino-thiazoline-4-carboxylic acid hydrolase [Eubacteriales bacterium]
MKLDKYHKMGNKLVEKIFPPELEAEIKLRLAELINENPNDSKALRRHSYAVIYPMIAAVQVRQKKGLEKSEAIAAVSQDYFQKFVLPNKKIMQKLLKFPLAYKFFIPICRLAMGTLYGEKAEFVNDLKVAKNNSYSYDVLKCPYHEICSRYNLAELVDTYCTTDDMVYGDLHEKIEFKRSKTLGRGDELCDFCFKEKSKTSGSK